MWQRHRHLGIGIIPIISPCAVESWNFPQRDSNAVHFSANPIPNSDMIRQGALPHLLCPLIACLESLFSPSTLAC